MHPLPATGGPSVSTRVLACIDGATRNDAPHASAVSVADALRLDLDLARSMLALLVRLGHVHPPALVLPRRWLHRDDVPVLDQEPARRRAERDRHARDLDVYVEMLARARLDLHPRAGTHLPSERGLLTGRARRDVLARLRDPRREGGALLWPEGALVLTERGLRALDRAAVEVRRDVLPAPVADGAGLR